MTVVSAASVAHGCARVEDIEAATAVDAPDRLQELCRSEAVEEAFVLQTCNRSEMFVVVQTPKAGQDVLAETVADLRPDVVQYMDHEESLKHLMRVASGLESLVLGEDQILGQIREAYEQARGAGAIGPMLEDAVTKAIHVGERARTETAINEGVISLGSAAVELASDERGVAEATTLVVGAGEMGTLAARAFADAGAAEVVVANRTIPNAEHTASELAVESNAVGLGDLKNAVSAADLVVTATGSDQPVIDRETVVDAGETYIIDIAQPRDVTPDVASVPGVTLRDLDSLEMLTERTREQRREAAREVEALVDAEFGHLLEQYKRKRADDVIAAMYESADRVKNRELAAALSKMEARGDVPDEQREAVEAMANALVNQLLAAPTKSLRDAAAEDDWTTINTALQLFNPEFGPTLEQPELETRPPNSIPSSTSED